MTLSLGHLFAAISDYQAAGNEPLVAFVTNDSRDVKNGAVFCAFQGEHVDGHKYVASAFAAGAIAAIVEKPVDDFPVVDCRQNSSPQWDGATPVCVLVENTLTTLQAWANNWRNLNQTRVIGITGSVGKTSTKELAYSVLSQKYSTLKSEKNFNTEIGLPLQLLNLRDYHERAILEMGMYVPGDIALLCQIAEPNVGVVTLVGSVHIERAGSQEAIVAGKRELVEALPETGVAILNYDEPLVMSMAPSTSATVVTYGLNDGADIQGTNIEPLGLAGVRFDLKTQSGMATVNLPVAGRHSVLTALRSAAIGLVEGMSLTEVVAGLESHSDHLRLTILDGPLGSTLLDDTYNASPRSTIAALDLLNDLSGRKIAILGNMLELGSDEVAGHQRAGKRAAEVCDELIAVGKLGRILGEAAVAAGLEQVHFAPTTADGVEIIQSLIEANDFILIKGSRGAELDKIVSSLTERVAEGTR